MITRERIAKKIFGIPPSTQVGTKNDSTRNAWVEKQLRSLKDGLTILDAGAGELHYKPYCAHLKYIAQDFGQYDGSGNGKGLQTQQWDTSKIDIISDIASIPLASSSFDAVLCSEVLEHVPDPVKALEELSRLVRKNGVMILTAPFCSLSHFTPFHFSTGLSVYWYQFHLSRLGYELQEVSYNGNYFEYLAQELRRLPSVARDLSTSEVDRDGVWHIDHILKLLDECSSTNRGSEELLCFGLGIFASKLC